MTRRPARVILLVVALQAVAAGALAATPAVPEEATALDRSQQTVASGLNTLVNYLDGFFSNEKVYYQSTGSYLALAADSQWDADHDSTGFTGRVRGKVNLTRTEEKLKFILESDADHPTDEINPELQTTPVAAAEQADIYAGLQQSQQQGQWRLRSTVGARARQPPDYFLRLRANRSVIPGSNWSLWLDEELFWFDSIGSGIGSVVEFDRLLSADRLFRTRSSARWLRDTANVDLAQVFSLYRDVGRQRVLVYQAGINGVTVPAAFVDDFWLAVRFRRSVYRDYLYMELVPRILYRKDNGFYPERTVLLRLEMVFEG